MKIKLNKKIILLYYFFIFKYNINQVSNLILCKIIKKSLTFIKENKKTTASISFALLICLYALYKKHSQKKKNIKILIKDPKTNSNIFIKTINEDKDKVIDTLSEIIFPKYNAIKTLKETLTKLYEEDNEFTVKCFIKILYPNINIDNIKDIDDNKNLLKIHLNDLIKYIVFNNFVNNNMQIDEENNPYKKKQFKEHVKLIKNFIPEYDTNKSIEDNIIEITKKLQYKYLLNNAKTLLNLLFFNSNFKEGFFGKITKDKIYYNNWNFIEPNKDNSEKDISKYSITILIQNIESSLDILLQKIINNKSTKILIAEKEGIDAGFLHYKEHDDYIFIEHLATKTTHTRQNIASTLMNYIKNCIKKPIYLFSSHPNSNSDAVHFYQKKQNFQSIAIESFSNNLKNSTISIPTEIRARAEECEKEKFFDVALYYFGANTN